MIAVFWVTGESISKINVGFALERIEFLIILFQVCKGDWLVVDVINQVPGKSASIHWHGLLQRKTPWMDGVSMVTQCPITTGQTFRYYFEADNSGTYFWHSHTGL